MNVFKGEDNRWYKPCGKCGELQSYLRKNYAEESLRLNKSCKKCSNRETDNCHRGWYKGIRVSWFNKFKVGAELRGLVFTISIDDVAELMEKQLWMCALTGYRITFPEVGSPQATDASIDRIDSHLGYTKENIQLVHKKVNMMKQHYSQEEFIAVCQAVADKVKW